MHIFKLGSTRTPLPWNADTGRPRYRLTEPSCGDWQGISDARHADVVEVAWPSGARTRLRPLDGDRRWHVTEDGAVEPIGRFGR